MKKEEDANSGGKQNRKTEKLEMKRQGKRKGRGRRIRVCISAYKKGEERTEEQSMHVSIQKREKEQKSRECNTKNKESWKKDREAE